nr:hypothetical protein [uncultured Holophaga sp.]
MLKLSNLILCIISITVGFAAGCLIAVHYYVNTKQAICQLEADSYSTVATLSKLREGHFDSVIQAKELELDLHILALGVLARERGKMGDEARHCLRRVASYRRSQSYVPNDPNVRREIEDAMKLATP